MPVSWGGTRSEGFLFDVRFEADLFVSRPLGFGPPIGVREVGRKYVSWRSNDTNKTIQDNFIEGRFEPICFFVYIFEF